MCLFIKNKDFSELLPEKRWRVIPYFDSVILTKHHFEINSVIISDTLGNKSSWSKLSDSINKYYQEKALEEILNK